MNDVNFNVLIKKPITVLSYDLKQTVVIDDYDVLIWTERYDEEGEFILELPIKYVGDSRLKEGYYLTIEGTDRFMIVGDMNPIVDSTEGTKYVLKGPSGENMLRWRVTSQYFLINGNLRQALIDLVYDNLVSPLNTARAITNFKSELTVLPVGSYDPDYINTFEEGKIFDIVKTSCKAMGMGFKVVLTDDLKFSFVVYSGLDRSYSQNVNQYVIFSESYDNVFSSNYYIGTQDYVSVALVLVDDDVEELQANMVHFDPEPEGIFRREVVVKASEIRRSVYGEPDLTDQEMLEMILYTGLSTINENQPRGVFDAEVDINGRFKYREKFDMGDLVQCIFVGLSTKARVNEHVLTIDLDGMKNYIGFDFNLQENILEEAPTS